MYDEPCDGPELPRMDPDMAAIFREWQEDHALPALFLTAHGPAPYEAGGSRIGGPVWLPVGEEWPCGEDGDPMIFIAQVDFSALPHLPDFPDSGALQFFVAHDSRYGADFNAPEKGRIRVLWRENFSRPGRLHDQPAHTKIGGFIIAPDLDLCTPLEDGKPGVALRGNLAMHLPTLTAWHLRRDLPMLANKGRGTVNALCNVHFGEGPERHHVGGHPEFTQDDWRAPEQYRHVDRVLLQLWSKSGLTWGDAGQGQFLIAREDLLKRDFSRVYYQWDCS